VASRRRAGPVPQNQKRTSKAERLAGREEWSKTFNLDGREGNETIHKDGPLNRSPRSTRELENGPKRKRKKKLTKMGPRGYGTWHTGRGGITRFW